MLRRGAVYLIILLVVLAIAGLATGCGTEEGASTTTTVTTVGELPVLTIEEALQTDPGSIVRVGGVLVATGTGSETETVLASALLESYPPQAGGPTLVLQGLSLSDLVGLTSTVGQEGLAPVTWSEYWLVVEGALTDGVLQVTAVPEVVAAETGSIRCRFSTVAFSYVSGETAWWAFDVQNTGTEPVRLVFSSGQRGDVILSQGGEEKYRWSDGKGFTQAIEEVTLVPGQVWSTSLNDLLPMPAGEYDVKAFVAANVAVSETESVPLPELSATIQVR